MRFDELQMVLIKIRTRILPIPSRMQAAGRYARARPRRAITALFFAAFISANASAFRHAWVMTHFAEDGETTARPEHLSTLEKIGVVFTGISVRRPQNDATPEDFSIRPIAIDFVALLKRGLLGEVDITRFQIADHDLALRGRPIVKAGPDLLSECGSAANERHLAINWILGSSALYSKTDTST